MTSLHKHWRRFGSPLGAATAVDVDRALDEIRRRRRRQEIEDASVLASRRLPSDTGHAEPRRSTR